MSFGIATPEKVSYIEGLLHQENGAFVIGMLAISMLVSTFIGWLAQSKIKEVRRTKLRVTERRIKARHLFQILEGLARTSCDQRVRELIGQRLLEIIEQIMDINQLEPGVKVIYAATQRLMQVPAKQTTYDISVADNDADIKHLQKLLLAALAQIKKLPRRGMLTYSECKSLELHIKMVYVQVEIDAHMQKAELAAETDDKGTAGNHYRIAQNKLAQSRYHGPDKREKMVEIGNTIRGLFKRPTEEDN